MTVTEDVPGYIATCGEIPELYGYGETPDKAMAMFWREVNSMWEDLSGAGEFGWDCLNLKNRLSKLVS